MAFKLQIKLARPFAGRSELKLDWPEKWVPNCLMLSSQGAAVFDLVRYENETCYYEPCSRAVILLEQGVHAVDAGRVCYITHSG
jgi:hypothetical protein